MLLSPHTLLMFSMCYQMHWNCWLATRKLSPLLQKSLLPSLMPCSSQRKPVSLSGSTNVIISGICPRSLLPPAIQRKVKALKNVQLDVTKLEAEFYKEVQRLEAKYQALYQPLFDKVQRSNYVLWGVVVRRMIYCKLETFCH